MLPFSHQDPHILISAWSQVAWALFFSVSSFPSNHKSKFGHVFGHFVVKAGEIVRTISVDSSPKVTGSGTDPPTDSDDLVVLFLVAVLSGVCSYQHDAATVHMALFCALLVSKPSTIVSHFFALCFAEFNIGCTKVTKRIPCGAVARLPFGNFVLQLRMEIFGGIVLVYGVCLYGSEILFSDLTIVFVHFPEFALWGSICVVTTAIPFSLKTKESELFALLQACRERKSSVLWSLSEIMVDTVILITSNKR
jgi:hypothetical protein